MGDEEQKEGENRTVNCKGKEKWIGKQKVSQSNIKKKFRDIRIMGTWSGWGEEESGILLVLLTDKFKFFFCLYITGTLPNDQRDLI